MKKGIYGMPGTKPNNNGVIDNNEEIRQLLAGMPEGEKLADILSGFALKDSVPSIIQVPDITALTGAQLDALRAGDIVNKSDVTGLHSYHVSYKSATGLCLTYSDCENVETVAYGKDGDTWAYDSTDVTHIAE